MESSMVNGRVNLVPSKILPRTFYNCNLFVEGLSTMFESIPLILCSRTFNVSVTELNEIETRESLSSDIGWKTKKWRRLGGTRRTNGESSMDEIIARCSVKCPLSDGIEHYVCILGIWRIPFEIVESKLFETLTSLTSLLPFSSALRRRSEKVSQWERKGSRNLPWTFVLLRWCWRLSSKKRTFDLVFDRDIRWKKLFDLLRRPIHLFHWHNV
jgi:hypothetical protein